MREWLLHYENPAVALSPLVLGFRDYVLAAAALEATEGCATGSTACPSCRRRRTCRSRGHRRRRAAALPPPRETLGADDWQRIKERARSERLTPSAVLLTKFADVLGAWSRRQQFTINLTLFQRLPLHPQAKSDRRRLHLDHAARRGLRGGRRVRSAGAHAAVATLARLGPRHVSGVKVIRELARRREAAFTRQMPVVFTSGIAQGMPELEQLERLQAQNLGEVIYAVSQTPQVWLDHQVYEQDGRLHLAWTRSRTYSRRGCSTTCSVPTSARCGKLADDEIRLGRRTRNPGPAGAAHRTRGGERHSRARSLRAPARPLLCTGPPAAGTDGGRHHDASASVTARLRRRADRLARRLRRLGAQPNRLVAIVTEKSWEQVVGALAY